MTMLLRAADFRPDTFDEAAMTVDAVISTFSDVNRRDQKGAYIERLDPTGLDTSRLVGAPVLDGHRQGSARDTIGVVTAFRQEDNSLIATMKLLISSDVAPIIDRIRQGILRGVSVGYRVLNWTETKDPETKARVRTAASWQIFEVSAVPIPADAGATFRSESMSLENETIDAPEVETPAQTRAEIRTIARNAGLTAEWADQCIDGDMTIIEVRAAAFEQMQTRTRNTPRIRIVGQSGDDPAVIRRHREDALFARVNGGAPEEHARQYMGDTLRDHARALLEATGISTRGMDADTLFTRAMHTTSDFPQLLTGVGNRVLMPAYQAAQSPLKNLARQSTINDFRTKTMLKLSDVGLLEKVSESGEIKSTTRGEAAEAYGLETFATLFGLPRKALINDDLGAFRDWGATAGRMAAETEANLLVKLLLSNPTMGEDNKKLFHVDHGNLNTAVFDPDTAISDLSDARKGMRKMKALDGKTPINATPRYLVVGPELETDAERWLSTIYATTLADVNAFSGKLTLVVEPRITDDRWYIFADPAILPVLEYAYLSSAQGPQMASREGWDVLGMEFRVVLDFGAGAIDWRGAYAKVPA